MKKTIKAIHRIALITLAVIMGAAMTSCVGFPDISFPIIIAGGDGGGGYDGGYSGGSQPTAAQSPTLDKIKFFNATTVQAANTSISGEVVIPEKNGNYNVSIILSSGFRNCTGITSVVIPASISTIYSYAFAGCTNLTSVTFQGTIAVDGSHFPSDNSFPGDLRAKYRDGGPGTYTRSPGGTVWTKQGGG